MSELAPQSQDELWSRMYTGHIPPVDFADRKFWPADMSPEELREIGDAIVRAAYINDGVRPKNYGNRIAQTGACIGTSEEVVKAAHKAGFHANYVENPDGTHGFVHLPTSPEEVDVVPEDPLILDPTYAQFMDGYKPDPITGEIPDPWNIGQKMKTELGINAGHHTPGSPYFIGRASRLNNPDSGVHQSDDPLQPTPWATPVIRQS